MPPRRRANFGAALTTEQPADGPSGSDLPAPISPPAGNGNDTGTGTNSSSRKNSGASTGNGQAHNNNSGGGGGNSKGKGKEKNTLNTNAKKGDSSKSNPKKAESTITKTNKNPSNLSPTAVTVTGQSAAHKDDMDINAEACFICAEPMHIHAVHPCNHTTCGRCALRLRALYKQSSCVYCKSKAQTVIFTTDPAREFSSFTPDETAWRDERLGLLFATEEDKENALQLLLFHCPHVGCDHTLPEASATVAGIVTSEAAGKGGTAGALHGWSGLKEHVGKMHHRSLCELCILHKKIFTYEHPLYTHRQLQTHSTTEHRKCEFCNSFFYGPDELYKHLRDKHFQCQMCAVYSTPDPPALVTNEGDDHESRQRRRAAEAAATHAAMAVAEAQTWYRDYPDLERHFDKKHYLCPDPMCRQQQYIVFSNEMDYNAHRLSQHANSMTAKEKRDALRVDAAFGESLRDIGGSTADSNRTRTVPGAAPSSRGSRRTGFGGRLTEPGQAPNSGLPQDAESAAQQAFIGLATAVLGASFSSSKLASMRTGLTTYRVGEARAEDLAATVWSVVDSGPPGEHPDAKVQNGASLIRGLADLLISTPSQGDENASSGDERAHGLLNAWSSLAATRNSFPTLVGRGTGTSTSSGTASRYASAAGSASTIRRAVGSVNRSAAAMDFFPALSAAPTPRSAQTNWGSSMPQPAASTSSASVSTSVRHAAVPGTAAHAARHRAPGTSSALWSTPSPAPSPSQTPKPTAQPAKVVYSTPAPLKGKAPSQAAFPGLPQKTSQADKWEEKRQAARAKTATPGSSVWGTSSPTAGASSPASTSSTNLLVPIPTASSSNKGKNKKGQTVLTLGSVRR